MSSEGPGKENRARVGEVSTPPEQLEFDPDRVVSNGLNLEQNMAKLRDLCEATILGKPIPGESTLLMDVHGRLLVTCPSCRKKGILDSPEPRGDWLAPPTFDFGTAVRLMQNGKKVRRGSWPSGEWMEIQGVPSGLVILHHFNRMLHRIDCVSAEDTLAEDWEVVP